MRRDLWETLTAAERELIRQLAMGKCTKQIGHDLRISVRAVHYRWQSCRRRLGCETRAHAVALLAGTDLLLDPPPDQT